MNLSEIKEISHYYVRELVGKSLDFGVRLRGRNYFYASGIPIIAVTWFSKFGDNINVNFSKHFNNLDYDLKVDVIKHECCHVADIKMNGPFSVFYQDNTGHGKTFNEFCDRIGVVNRKSVNYNCSMNPNRIMKIDNIVIER